ncbi:glutathione synthase [Ectothiorhodospiraceae bacterium BW-2]|nr:glutathione synthase [Ectothiorhodospiraceae bacterium BW-2]
MSFDLGIIMDPIESIKVAKDSSLAMLLAAQQRGWRLYYMTLDQLWQEEGVSYGRMRQLAVKDDPKQWYRWGDTLSQPLSRLDLILMRKDPPFDLEYLYACHFLQQAQSEGTLIVNRPQSLAMANEKLFIGHFPHCCAPTLVSRCATHIRTFLEQQQAIVVKPLDSMGGASVFKLTPEDSNVSVILETLTHHGRRQIMAQRYLPEISQGDKRILLIDGEPIPYALARIPAPGELRGNLAAGGRGEGVPLTERDAWICAQLAPTLKEMGLIFVGIDVIGDYLTEINVTSPTCIRELDRQFQLNIGGQLMDALAAKLTR